VSTAAVIGVDLGGTKCHAVLSDDSGRVVDEVYRSSDHLPDPVDVLLGVIGDLRASAAACRLAVRGIAIGVPAFIDPDSGLVVGGWNLGWDRFDLRARLESVLTEPCTIDNDVNLAALGEARIGAGQGARCFATVSIGTGLGGAVVVDGTLLRGRHGAAGEFGFLLADRGQLGRPGLMGMESRVGGPWIAARMRELAPDHPGAGSGAAAVFAAARQGNRGAEQVLAELLEHVAMTIVDVTAVVDPELVVLDGSIGRALEPYLPQLVGLVGPSVLYPPDLRVSVLAPNSTLAGAVAEAWRVGAARRR
jgi:glucokinase